MGLTLSVPPGYSDISDAVLAAGQPALGLDLAKIYLNSVFSLARTEVFQGLYINGDTVPLPVSPIDGYTYQRSELIYFWTIQNTVDQATGWITGKDSLYYAAWLVDQATGEVYSDEWYRTSGHSGVPNGQVNDTHTNDGSLWVFTIAQRGLTSLIMAAMPSFSPVSGTAIGATDKPFTQAVAQGLNDDAKFAVVDHEVVYCGEFTHGDTVPMPVSPADGYTYSYAECKFLFSWRWTYGSATFNQPPSSYGQLGPMQASVNSSGIVSISETYIDNSGNLFSVNVGRISVFAFTQRSGTPSSLTPTANQFAELDFDDFLPGADLPFTVAQQIYKNLQQGMLTPEFFGPTTHASGDTVPTPTSPIDGYAYSRSELTYLWCFTDTTPASGSNVRVASFGGTINSATGVVSLYGYRLPPGGPYAFEDTTKPRISVITIARRMQQAVVVPAGGDTTNPQTDSSSVQTDVPAAAVEVNGTVLAGDSSFSDSTPAAPSGKTNVKWQHDALSPTDVSAYMPVLVGDSGSGGTSGAVPAPASGDAAAGKFLKADGTWEVPAYSSVPNFADGEAVTASGTSATLAHTPNPAASLILVVDGAVFKSGSGNDYTLSGAAITFATAPRSGANIQAWYRY